VRERGEKETKRMETNRGVTRRGEGGREKLCRFAEVTLHYVPNVGFAISIRESVFLTVYEKPYLDFFRNGKI